MPQRGAEVPVRIAVAVRDDAAIGGSVRAAGALCCRALVMTEPGADTELLRDPLLRAAPTIEGFKVLDPAVLYAKVGQGGMGAVYRGRHCKLDLDVAVKCLKPQLAAESPEFVARFEREARLAASLAHQNVVRVMDVQQRDGLHYLVMEFVRGESVRERVQRKGPLGEQEALAILLGAAAGLAEAHGRGIVHRDIKPDNLLVSLEGRVKLADLGLAKAQAGSDHSLSLASGVMGTPQYMAPEQWDSPDVGPAADVWALGASLYYVLTGGHGIEGATLAAMARRVQEHDFPSLAAKVPTLRPEVLALFARCVARRPDERFASAKELLAALRPLVHVGEEALADAAAGSNQARLGVVTPPPRQTLLRIRAVLETGTQRRDGAGGDAAFGEAPTMPSPGGTVPMAPPRARSRQRPWLVVAALALLGGGTAVAGYAAGWFDDEVAWQEVQRQVQAKGLYQEGLALLPRADGLDGAIAKFEQALGLVTEFPLAKQRLALALDKRAEQRTDVDVDAAFVDVDRAVELDPQNTAAAQRRDELRRQLSARMLFGLRVVSPVDGEVVAGARFPVRGTVAVPGVTQVEVVVTAASELPGGGERPSRRFPAIVVAGAFEVTVDAPDAGRLLVGLAAADRHGVRGGCLPTRALVPGVVGALGQPPVPGSEPPRIVVAGCGSTMQPIPLRTFAMGSNLMVLGRGDDEMQHRVVMNRPFWLATTEVTRQQWRTVMGSEPWLAADAAPGSDDERAASEKLPATSISWDAANDFCAQLTEREREAGRLPAGYRYCLPSEAQWELAACGGGIPDFPHGDDREVLGEHAVFGGAGEQPAAVASKTANAFGLHDLAGNVDEWCADAATGEAEVTTFTYVDDVQEPLSEIGLHRVVRGGNFRSPAADCRCAARTAASPDTVRDSLGFRIALAKR